MQKVILPKILLGLAELTFLFVYFGDNHSEIFGVLTLNFLVLIGLYYLINRLNKIELQEYVRKSSRSVNKSSKSIFFSCQNCNNKAIRGDIYCQYCGVSLQDNEKNTELTDTTGHLHTG